MNILLQNACNGRYASGKGLNKQDMINALVKEFPDKKHLILNPSLNRKQLEALCKELMLEKQLNQPKQLSKSPLDKSPKKQNVAKKIGETKLLECKYPQYLKNIDECSKINVNELYQLANECGIPVDFNNNNPANICADIIQYITKYSNQLHQLGLEGDIIYDNLTPEIINAVKKYLLDYMSSYAKTKNIESGFPTNIVLCHGREHKLQFPDKYILADINPFYRPDIVADSALIALGFPDNWVENLIIKGCPSTVYSDPFFWDQWLPKIKEGGHIIITNLTMNMHIPAIVNKYLEEYFISIGIPKPTVKEYISNLLSIAGQNINNYKFYDAYMSNDPNNYDPNHQLVSKSPYTKPILIIEKL